MKYTHDVKPVIKNLELLLQHKEAIQEWSLEGSLEVFDFPEEGMSRNGNSGTGHLHRLAGVCYVADLWYVDKKFEDDETYYGVNNLVEHLGKKFISTRYLTLPDQHKKFVSVVNPVSTMDWSYCQKWTNPLRWDYIEFCLAELKYIHDNDGQVANLNLVEWK